MCDWSGYHCMIGLAVVVLYLLVMGLCVLRNHIRACLDRRSATAAAARGRVRVGVRVGAYPRPTELEVLRAAAEASALGRMDDDSSDGDVSDASSGQEWPVWRGRRSVVAVAPVRVGAYRPIELQVLRAAEELFQCGVCLDDAGAEAGKPAVSLPCSHRFCRDCAKRVDEDARARCQEPLCPICRQPAVKDDSLAAAAAATALADK